MDGLKPIAVAAAVDYSPAQVRPFVATCPFPCHIWSDRDTGGIHHPWNESHVLVHNRRFRVIRDWLVQQTDITHVFFADSRDVVFQSNPFEHLKPGLNVFCESELKTMGQCPYNNGWAKDAYGEQWALQVQGLPILCVGTVAGPYQEMCEWLNLMVGEIDAIGGGWLGADTAAFHRIIWNHHLYRLVQVSVHDNTSAVYTVGYEPFGSVPTDQCGMIINRAGRIPAVVHQYDRHPNLLAAVNQRLVRL